MSAQASIRITNPAGLHARPAVKLAQLAASFNADIQLRLANGDWIKARSVAKVTKLKAAHGTELQLRADGVDAESAIAALVGFVKRNFDEEGNHAHSDSAATPTTTPKTIDSDQRVHHGITAAPGIAIGPLFLRTRPSVVERSTDSPAVERQILVTALATAQRTLSQLGAESDSLGAEILSFQLGLLTDEALIDPIYEAIDNGASAAQAWHRQFEEEIADYLAATDEYFRARAADLRDLRDRVLQAMGLHAESDAQIPPTGAILLADELTPSEFLALDWSVLGGAAVSGGSYNDHVAMLARAQEVPLLIALDDPPDHLIAINRGTEAVLIGEPNAGRILLNPTSDEDKHYQQCLAAQHEARETARRSSAAAARSADGHRLKIYINLDDPSRLASVNPDHCDGIGLTRTELLMPAASMLADEQKQYLVYRQIVEWAGGKPVTIRTLDAGGDKPIAGLTLDNEPNPFLGVRGLRLSLRNRELFLVQLRALARAAAIGPIKVLLPMVTIAAELASARELLQQACQSLEREQIEYRQPALGIMIEVPAAALAIEQFDADFYSIGTNDLIQYTVAAGRDQAQLAALQDPLNPALLELIGRVTWQANRTGREVSVCGEMAANPNCLPALLAAGVSVFSVPPESIGKIKSTLATLRVTEPTDHSDKRSNG